MKKNYLAPEMLVEDVMINEILTLSASDSPADSTKPVLSKEIDIEDDEEEEW